MNDMEVIPVLVKMIFSFFAAFGAIALWSKSRDAAWVLAVLSAIFYFIEALFSTLVILGVATYQLPFMQNIPLLESVLAGLPPFFLSVAFLVFLIRNRRY